MKKRIVLTLLLTTGVVALYCQIDNPALGYVITSEGDTLFGTLNLDNEVILSRGVYWYSSGDNTASVYYSPTEIQEFGFSDSRYRYRPIQHTYTRDDDTIKQEATRFARLIYDGPIKLYRLGVPTDEFYKVLEDIPPWAYYLQTEEGEYIKLEVLERQLNSTMGYPYAQYRGPLKYLMRDWPGGQEMISKVNFMDDDLVDLIRQYVSYKYPDFIDEKIESTGRTTKVTNYLHLTYGGWAGALSNATYLNGVAGIGYLVKFYNPYIDNSLEIATGLEYLNLNYMAGQENEEVRVFSGWTLRLPIHADFYLTNKWKNIQPRLKGSLLLAFLRRKGEYLEKELVFINNRWEEIPVGYFPYGEKSMAIHFAVGIGADLFDRFRVDIQYEKKLGFLLSAGVVIW